MATTPNYDVFISHTSADTTTARQLAEHLSSLDLNVFLDVDDIQPGQDFVEVISDALENSRAIAVLLSSAASASGYTSSEISSATANARAGRSLLIPVYLDEHSARNAPQGLEKFQGVRVLDYSELEPAAEKIAQAVKDTQPVSIAQPKPSGNIPPEPSNYVPNTTVDDIVRIVESALAQASGPVQVIGPAGMGKSTAVAEACRRLRARFSVIWWLRSGSAEDIVDNLAALGERLQIDNAETANGHEAAAATVDYLESTTTTWCLVFDEADPKQDFSRWVPKSTRSGTSILIGREYLPWAHGRLILHVSGLNTEESARYLQAQLAAVPDENPDDSTLASIAETLDGSPLLLKLAGSYLARSAKPPIEGQEQLLELIRDSPSSAETLIDESLSQAAASKSVAVNIFLALGWLADPPFPADAILQAAEDPYLSSSQSDVSEAIENLRTAGLINVTLSQITMHTIIRRFARDRSESSAIAFLARSIERFLDESPDAAQQSALALSAHVTQILGEVHRLEDDPARDDVLEVGLRLARRLVQYGQDDDARSLLEQTLAANERALGPDHPSALTVRADLANVYLQLGRSEEALALLQQALADSERILGPDHPSTLSIRANLANVCLQLGRSEEALALLQQTLADSERILGPDHPSTLTARANLANVYLQLGRSEEALALLQQALADSERILGPDHPSTLSIRANLANVYLQTGRAEEAMALLQQALADSERILGPDHPSTLSIRANLANVYLQTGRAEEALALLQRTLADSERILGPDDLSTLIVRANLASVYLQTGRADEAEALLQQALADSQRSLGPDNPLTRTVRANLEYVRNRSEGSHA